MKCRQAVPDTAKAGDKCPHCGVLWDVEEDAQGHVVNYSSHYLVGKIVGGIVVALIVIASIARALGKR